METPTLLATRVHSSSQAYPNTAGEMRHLDCINDNPLKAPATGCHQRTSSDVEHYKQRKRRLEELSWVWEHAAVLRVGVVRLRGIAAQSKQAIRRTEAAHPRAEAGASGFFFFFETRREARLPTRLGIMGNSPTSFIFFSTTQLEHLSSSLQGRVSTTFERK